MVPISGVLSWCPNDGRIIKYLDQRNNGMNDGGVVTELIIKIDSNGKVKTSKTFKTSRTARKKALSCQTKQIKNFKFPQPMPIYTADWEKHSRIKTG